MRFCIVRCLAISPSVALHCTSLRHQPPLKKAQRMRPLQSLTFEAMRDLLSTACGLISDTRQPDRVHSSLHDTLMSGFAMMFFHHASLLEFQRKMKQRRGRCNLGTIFGVHEVPSDTQRREILDGVPPAWLRQVFPALFAKVRRGGWGKEFPSTVPSGHQQGDYYSAILDGSDYCHSTTVQCPGCLQRVDANGDVHFRHTVVSAT